MAYSLAAADYFPPERNPNKELASRQVSESTTLVKAFFLSIGIPDIPSFLLAFGQLENLEEPVQERRQSLSKEGIRQTRCYTVKLNLR